MPDPIEPATTEETTETNESTPESVSTEEGVVEMLEEAPSPESAESEETPGTKETPAEKVKEGDDDFVLKPPEPKKEEKPAKGDLVKVGDNEYTKEQIAKDPELLDKVIQSARQFPTAQRKYDEVVERLASLEKRVLEHPAPEKEGAKDGAFTPATLADRMSTLIDQAVEQGFVESDYAKLFPCKSALDAYNHQRIDILVNTVMDLLDGRNQTVETQQLEQQQQEVLGTLNSVYEELAASAPAFRALGEQKVRDLFTEHLADDIDLPVDAINAEMVGKLYKAWCSPSYDEQMRVLLEEIAALKSGQFLHTESPTPRVGPSGTGPVTQAEEVLDLVTD